MEFDMKDGGKTTGNPERPSAADAQAVRIRDWIVARLYASDPPELSAVEPMPLFDMQQVEDGMEVGDDQ
jgi:hypothetical protein